MIKSTSLFTTSLSALVISCAMAAILAQPAAAQTAKKLDCKGCVKSKQLKNNGIKSKDIKDGQVKSDDLANSAVIGAKIQDGAVTGAKIQDGAVTGGKVEDGSLTGADLADEPGANFANELSERLLTSSFETVISVTLVAPRPGVVIVNASGQFGFLAGSQIVTCTISRTPGAALPGSFSAENDDLISALPFAATRAFEVPAGSVTVDLRCREEMGSSSLVDDLHMNAIYVPERY